ncbi:MAG: PAQR family membrane homeostasis protein TrhA [Longimicrobiales bacterium]
MGTWDREELANTLTHAVGVFAALVGGAALVVYASLGGDPWRIAGVSVFAFALVALYAASTAYHAARSERIKRRLKVLDHCAIYLLIAGSYTPFLLNDLRGPWGWSLFGVIWSLALAGMVFKLFFTGRFRLVSTLVYVMMGWLALVAIVPMLRNMHMVTLGWMLAGGIAYTAGTPFYHAVRMRYSHAVWHLFVLAGSVCHAIAVATQL